jgi:hypothetical protein
MRVLRLRYLVLEAYHCRAIDALTRIDLQIELNRCKPTESGKEILLECIRQNRGPTELSSCRIDAGRLRGNNNVANLTLPEECSDEERLVLVQALAENMGLGTLNIKDRPITDEMWTVLWQSVARYPTLEKLVLPQRLGTWRDGNTDAQSLSECKPWWMRFA